MIEEDNDKLSSEQPPESQDAQNNDSKEKPASETQEAPTEENPTEEAPNDEAPKKKKKGHRWLRITLRVLLCLIILILLIPVLLYVPPVQTFVKNVACNMVHKSTGMDISIDKFRLKWPVDLSLQGVTIVEATGDTMVNAREVIADVKLMPLLNLDVQIKRLSLLDGYYRMLSPDSSMLLKLNAGLLTVDDQSSADMRDMRIVLNKALLKDGKVSLFMDVWKQQAKSDTTSTPFFIAANDLTLENFTFGMSMLPTIDTLNLVAQSLKIRNGIVDLGKNQITADYLGASGGNALYLTPTPEYIASHPAPAPDTTAVAVASPPMIIKGDTVELTSFKALYGVKDAKPLPGFDPSYIDVTDVNVLLHNFYNASSTLELPIASITAKERSGLEIIRGSGTVGIDSTGLALRDLSIATPYSTLGATAGLPFALMALQPSAPVNVKIKGNVGMPDIDAFMPDLAVYTRKLPQRAPLGLDLVAEGKLSDVTISQFAADMPGVFSLAAKGKAANALDFKKLRANLEFDGSVVNPAVVDGLLGNIGFKMPRLQLKGTASAVEETYGANFKLLTSVGDVAADGRVSMTAESYDARVNLTRVNVAHFAPTLGVGPVTASLRAKGAGFNPERPRASTDIQLDIASVVYNKQTLRNIVADVQLHNGLYTIQATSNNALADFNIQGSGTVDPDLYTFDVKGNLTHLDLQQLGLTPDKNEGSGQVDIKGTASPGKWNYDVDLSLHDIKWTVADQVYDIPGNLDAKFRSGPVSVNATVDALLTSLRFDSPVGLKQLMGSFTTTTDTLNRQIKNRFIDFEHLQGTMPPFSLGFNASGRGTVGHILNTMGLRTDTIYAALTNDSTLYGNVGVRNMSNGSMRADTLTLNLSQRGSLLDYKLHMGNRPNNPIAEFADVNLNGYVGSNRVLLSLTQKNQKGKTGYRLGMTASYLDSVATVHFTPLKATIAYLPWQFNADNHVDLNVISRRIVADLRANSNESSILLQTQVGRNNNDELHLVLDNIHVQDFLQLSVFAPPLTASVNADLNVGYTQSWFYGGGSVGIKDFTYDRQRVGDFDLGLRAGYNNDGTTAALATLVVDGDSAVNAKMRFAPDSTGVLQTKRFDLELTRFPLKVANAFLGRDVASLSGYLNGNMNMKGSLVAPILNGRIDCDSVGVYIPMIGSTMKFNNDSVSVADNVVRFDKFDVWGANENPLQLDGTVDARKFSNILFNLGLNGHNVQLIGNDKNSGSEVFGKLFIDMDANVTGSMRAMNINADVKVLNTTDLTYSMSETTAQLNQLQDAGGVVKFVNFNDTTTVAEVDTVAPAMAMRIMAGLRINPGTRVAFDIPGSAVTGSGSVKLEPEGTLNYFQNYMGDMRLNGQLNLTEGTVRYGLAMGAVKADFTLDPSSYVHWSGDLMNPTLNVSATDMVKTNLVENGNSRLVNFLVNLSVTNTLSAPKVLFDLSTDDDMSVQNDLMSMSADQRSMAAINLLLTGQYSAGGVRTASSDLLQKGQGMLYGLLASQVNNFLANHVKGVDISLGVDQYDKMVNGESGTATSYSYTMSKSLFDDRFKISVGGNYTTDASADENFSENLISDISFEYILRQTSNITMYARLFRHTGYESILEGEITETGAGFVMKRRLETLKNLFNFLPGKRRTAPVNPPIPPIGSPLAPAGMPVPANPNDSVKPESADKAKSVDSVNAEKNDSIK